MFAEVPDLKHLGVFEGVGRVRFDPGLELGTLLVRAILRVQAHAPVGGDFDQRVALGFGGGVVHQDYRFCLNSSGCFTR